MSIDPDKPSGHACGANGKLLDASVMDWSEPEEELPVSAIPAPQAIEEKSLKHNFFNGLGSARRPSSSAVKPVDSRRKNLTLSDKLMILNWMTEHPTVTQKETATHFQKKFPTINQSTVSRMVKEKANLLERAKDTTQLSYKWTRLVEHPEIEASLRFWCLQTLGKGVKLSGDLIRAKAVRFQDLLGLPDDEKLAFSDGWLDKFKQRLGLKEFRTHGEAGSVSLTNVMSAVIRMRKITDLYPLRDIFNMDETGLFYRMPPDRGLAQKQTSGIKGDKT